MCIHIYIYIYISSVQGVILIHIIISVLTYAITPLPLARSAALRGSVLQATQTHTTNTH